MSGPDRSERALLLAPRGRDAAVATSMLSEAGIAAEPCGSIPGLLECFEDGVGFVLVTEEALLTTDTSALAGWIAAQEEWSDLPFILLTTRGGGLERNPAAARYLGLLGNVTFIERPFHPTTLVSIAQSALRGRRRQYDARARLLERTAERDRMWETSPDLMLIVDFEGVIRRVNPAWTTLLNYGSDELVGRHVHDFMVRDDLTGADEADAFIAGNDQPTILNRYRHKDGSLRWISWTAAPGVNMTYATGRDITEDKERQAELQAAQEALRQSQKMEAMGQLTGGVAHDFNNLLTPIVGSLDLLQRRQIGGEREQRLIAGAVQSAERAKTLVQRLLAFARRQPLQATAVDVGDLVRGMAELIGSTSGPQVKMVVDVTDDLPPASADPNQLEMAILNLSVNARDAMPEGGTLRITARKEEIKGKHRSGLPSATYICLSIADTGDGMDEATLARAVEPFFSTKGVGKGTGLGLSMVHGLASQLGGALTIQSRSGLGTNVEFWLPVSSAAVQGARPAREAPAPRTGKGTVLLVDDEEFVRLSTADMLSDLGYEVTEAVSAESALALIRGGLRPDLVVSDHLMPGMTGTDLARILQTELSGVRVLIVSGYAEDHGVAPDLPRLTKPFRNDELAASLAELYAQAA